MQKKIDRRGIGGFYESIMALMIVTVGVGMLTFSFTIISSDGSMNADQPECRRIMEWLLDHPSVAISDRLLDVTGLAHLDFESQLREMAGVKVMLAYPDGSIDVCFQEGEWSGLERWSVSEAVNVFYSQADIRPAMLIVWVWS